MAERVDDSANRLKYAWDLWFDGSTWKLRRGEDFKVVPKSMRSVIYGHAARSGLKVQSSVGIDPDGTEFIILKVVGKTRP